MADAELLAKVKTGLSISGTQNDAVLTQKMLAVTNFITNAGVNDEQLSSDLGVACICVGVSDLWELTAGDIKFSPVFGKLVEQLAIKSLPETSG